LAEKKESIERSPGFLLADEQMKKRKISHQLMMRTNFHADFYQIFLGAYFYNYTGLEDYVM